MLEQDRQLGLALSSDEGQLIIKFLAEVLNEAKTTPERGGPDESVDSAATLFRAGQISVLNKLRLTEKRLHGD